MPKWLRWLNCIFCGIALILVGIAFFTSDTFTSYILLLAGLFILFAFILTAYWYTASSFHIDYNDTGIVKRWGKITYKRIPYSRIKGASLECAVTYRYDIPYRDEQRREKAALILYESDISFLSSVSSRSCYPVHFSVRFNSLCSDFLDVECLKKALEKTNAKIYITEQILYLHKEILDELLKCHPARFVVAYCDQVDNTEKRISYQYFSVQS